MKDYIFRREQKVRWSKAAFEELGKKWIKLNYGLGVFIVFKTEPVEATDRKTVGHKQLVTVQCCGKCRIPIMNQAKGSKCGGNCRITYSGKYFKPAQNSSKRNCRSRKTSK